MRPKEFLPKKQSGLSNEKISEIIVPPLSEFLPSESFIDKDKTLASGVSEDGLLVEFGDGFREFISGRVEQPTDQNKLSVKDKMTAKITAFNCVEATLGQIHWIISNEQGVLHQEKPNTFRVGYSQIVVLNNAGHWRVSVKKGSDIIIASRVFGLVA